MKKQTKSDAEFIAKIKTLSVVTKHSNAAQLSAMAEKWNVPETFTAPDGKKMTLQFATETEITVCSRCKKPKRDESAEESFAA